MKKIILLLCYVCLSNYTFAKSGYKLYTTVTGANVFIVVIDSAFHQKYGFAYPMTYQLTIPNGLSGLHVQRKYATSSAWSSNIQEKTAADTFNAIEAVRFDYTNNRAYVSAAFSSTSDSLFIRILNASSQTIRPTFNEISKYYDNRVAAVTVSSDDWCDGHVSDTNNSFASLLDVFRSYKLYVTVGIITGNNTESSSGWYSTHYSWTIMQQQLDSGFVEAASHSRTHSGQPFNTSEVVGSYNDIIDSLILPPLFCSGSQQYVYTWISPFGNWSDSIYNSGFGPDSVNILVGTANYLIARLYPPGGYFSDNGNYIIGLPDSTFAAWDINRNHFKPILPVLEIGSSGPSEGDTDLISLNTAFDNAVESGDIYHLMFHPQYLFRDINATYFRNHLAYISGKTNIWYVNLGHLYLYHLLQTSSDSNQVLPVELTKFTALSSGTSVELKWTTATEVNNYGFDVERRVIVNGPQGSVSWNKIGFVKGSGTSNIPHTYSFSDSQLQSGSYAYRLKQIDNDGTFKYSQSVEEMIETPKIFSLRQNYPNPFNPSTTISFDIPLDSYVSLKVFDMLGREVATLISEKMSAGTYTHLWNASGLTSGVYFYSLQAGSYIETKKLLFLK